MMPRFHAFKYWCAAVCLAGLAAMLGGALPICSPGYAQDDQSDFVYVEVKVLDPDGKPMTGVSVRVAIDQMKFPMPVDERGLVSLNVPTVDTNYIELKVEEDGYVPLGAWWRKGDRVPEKLTIQMQKGAPIGGLVKDEKGQPIEGVKIKATIPLSPPSSSSHNSEAGRVQPLINGTIAKTDAQGRWQADIAPDKPINLYLKLEHPDYVSDTNFGQRRATLEQLRKLDHVFVMEKGIELRGKIVSQAGQPIVGAKVAAGSSRFTDSFETTETNENGEYVLKNVPAGNTVLTVFAEHWSPVLRPIVVQREMKPVDFQLEPGRHIRIRVTDSQGEPISDVWIAPDTWRGHRSVGGVMPKFTTDAAGVWQSDSAPADEIQYDILKQGYMSVRKQNLTAREEEYVIVLLDPLVVQGQVVDGETGKPIEHFKVVQGIRWDPPNQSTHWERYNVKPSRNGKYRTEFDEPRFGHLVRIEADGYRPAVSRLIRDDEGEVTIDFKLEAGAGPSGLVKLPNGKPAADVEVLTATANEGLSFSNGRNLQDRPSTKTDAQGRFTLPFQEGEFVVVCLCDAGWAQVDRKQLEESPEIQLQAWARVEGTLHRGKEPASGEQVALYFLNRYQANRPQVYWSYRVTTDGEGAFFMDRVIEGTGIVARTIAYAKTDQGSWMVAYSHGVPVELQAGKTAHVKIGGEGRQVRGQLSLPDSYKGNVAWNMGIAKLNEQSTTSGAKKPVPPTNTSQPKRYAAAIDTDGTFQIDDVLPGQYQLWIQLYAPPTDNQNRREMLGTLNQSCTVPEATGENADQPVDLGKHVLQLTPPPAKTTGNGTVDVRTNPSPD